MFDGKPTQLKSGELAKRYERRQQATASLEEAKEEGEGGEGLKFPLS